MMIFGVPINPSVTRPTLILTENHMNVLVLASAALIPAAAIAAPQAAVPPSAQSAVAGGYTMDTPVEVIVADPRAKAILDTNFPGMTAHERFAELKTRSLNELRPILEQHFSAEQIAMAAAELARLTPAK
ncbi:hypothetical protein [Sphingomonas oligophenolica]